MQSDPGKDKEDKERREEPALRLPRRRVLAGASLLAAGALLPGARALALGAEDVPSDGSGGSNGSVSPGAAAPAGPDSADVLVVGCGAAGLAAAVSAREAGAARVVILEKSALAGGHMIVSNGMLNALDPAGQRRMGRKDSAEAFFRDTFEGGGCAASPELVEALVAGSRGILARLEAIGVEFDPDLYEAYTGVFPRAHRTIWERSGLEYTRRLLARARSLGVTIRHRHRAWRILTDPAGVSGVLARGPDGEARVLRAKSVVIATGGFGASLAMRAQWAPQIPAELGTTYSLNRMNEDLATGDGIRMGLEAGAAVTGMEHVVVIPFWGGRVLDYPGAEMFLTREGHRFTDETAPWNAVFDDLARTGSGEFWVITDSRSAKGATFATKVQQGRVMSAETIEELARRMQVDLPALRESIERYNAAARSGADPEFGRTRFLQDLSSPPYYFGRERFEVHYTCGGLAIRPDAAVIAADAVKGASPAIERQLDGLSKAQVLPGLFAAGETTGGVHGKFRLGGSGLLDAFVFGLIAGRSAAARAGVRLRPL